LAIRGGTFDISIIRVDGENIDVLCSNGITKLGGDNFDRALVRLVKDKYEKATGTAFNMDDFTINGLHPVRLTPS
jgi:molecular chaperone DnaK